MSGTKVASDGLMNGRTECIIKARIRLKIHSKLRKDSITKTIVNACDNNKQQYNKEKSKPLDEYTNYRSFLGQVIVQDKLMHIKKTGQVRVGLSTSGFRIIVANSRNKHRNYSMYLVTRHAPNSDNHLSRQTDRDSRRS